MPSRKPCVACAKSIGTVGPASDADASGKTVVEGVDCHGETPNYSAYYHPSSGYLKLSGYYVSTEVCADSEWWRDTFVGYADINIGCAQSAYGAP